MWYCNKFVLQLYHLFCSCGLCFAVVQFFRSCELKLKLYDFLYYSCVSFCSCEMKLQLYNLFCSCEIKLQLYDCFCSCAKPFWGHFHTPMSPSNHVPLPSFLCDCKNKSGALKHKPQVKPTIMQSPWQCAEKCNSEHTWCDTEYHISPELSFKLEDGYHGQIDS
jgi:hypothetical protein